MINRYNIRKAQLGTLGPISRPGCEDGVMVAQSPVGQRLASSRRNLLVETHRQHTVSGKALQRNIEILGGRSK